MIFLRVHCRGGVKEDLHARFAVVRLELKPGPIDAQHQLLVLLVEGPELLLPPPLEGGVLERAPVLRRQLAGTHLPGQGWSGIYVYESK